MVDLENEENWTWFMEQLSYMLTPQERTITFVSDRNKGLLEDHIVHLFCKCAYAPNTPEAFDMHLRVLKDEGGSVMRTFLDSLPKENWSDAFFEGARYGEMWFNVAESFNSRICEEQYLPIYQLVDGIRVKMMEMNSERFRAAHNWNTFLCPEMEERLNQVLEVGNHWEISRSSLSIFERVARCLRVGTSLYCKGIFVIFVQKSTCCPVNIFGSTNAPTPVGLLAEKGSRCRDLLALGNLGLLPILM
ncbi:hypothetical protein FF2_008082 [Malus domestica]